MPAPNATAKSVVKRKQTAHNYAALSKKGFSTSKLLQKVGNKNKMVVTNMASPELREIGIIENDNNSNSEGVGEKQGEQQWPKVIAELFKGENANLHSAIKTTSVKAKSKKVGHTGSNLNTVEDTNITKIITGMSTPTLAEKKAKLLAEIANLEEQVQEEEDEELRQLMEKQRELKKCLAKAKYNSKVETKQLKQKVTIINEKMVQSPDCKIDREVKEKLECFKDLLHVTDKRSKSKRRGHHKKCKTRKHSTSESEDESESSTDSDDDPQSTGSDSSGEENMRKKRKGKRGTSGMFAKAGSSHIINNEKYAHVALESEVGSRSLEQLPFNLLVAGELEIISDPKVKEKEKYTRIEILKKLAYKSEYISQDEVMNQYTSFINKVEKGKFKWGSKSDLRTFKQNLIYSISVESRRWKKRKPSACNSKFEDRKKYCLDFNRGVCKFNTSHEGKINGTNMFKLDVCRECLVNEDMEVAHAERDCPSKNK